MKQILFYVGIIVVFLFGSGFTMQSRLDDIHSKIKKEYPFLNHVNADEFGELDATERVVFDVRKEKEFGVSHIEGAIRVDPQMDTKEFLSLYGDLIKDKKAVFYCSVGRRSSAFAARVRDTLEQSTNDEIYNLEGGIFRWHNEDRPLRQSAAPTDYVHPYNVWWSRLIEDKKSIRYKPVKDE